MDFPWQWIFTTDGEQWQAQAEHPPAPRRPFEELWAQLQRPANDQLAQLVLVGWDDDLLQIIAADPVLATKRLVLLLRRADVAPAAAALATWTGQQPLATVYEDRGSLLSALRPFAGAFDLVLIDPDPDIGTAVAQGRHDNYFRMVLSLDRNLADAGHIVARVDSVPASLPLDAWRGAFAGWPALCLAAGPSLDRHLDRIRAWQGSCVVVCVDLVAARLAEAGVRVDFVVNVDSAASLVRRCRTPADPHTVLITDLAGNPALDRIYPRRSYTSSATGIEGRLLPRPMLYSRGTNVGSATVGWASYLGCTDLILAGHDLCYEDTAYYSSLVPERDEHAAGELKASPVRIEVPGNDGRPHVTNYEFKVGIDDLGMMISRMPGVRVWNLNAGTPWGAVLPRTEALPAGWAPPDRPCPRPGDPEPVGRLPRAASLIADTRAQLALLAERWRALRAAGHDVMAAQAALQADPQLDCASGLFCLFLHAHVAHLVRLRACPGSGHTAALIAATEAQVDALLEPWAVSIGRVLDGAWAPTPVAEVPPALGAWRQEICDRVPQAEAGSDDHSAIPFIARSLRELRRELPGIAIPPPLDETDAVQVVMTLRGEAPPEAVLRCLAWCMLAGEPLAHIVEAARRHGLLAATGHASGPALAGATCRELAALAALEQVRAGVHAVDIVCAAAAWPVLWPVVLDVLLPAGGGGSWPVVVEVVRRGAIRIDDATGALIIGRTPDVLGAIDLIEAAGGSLRDGVALAAARRMAAIADHGAAIEQALAIRPLSRHADAALALCCESLVAAERTDDVQRLLGSLPSRRQALRVLLAFLNQRMGTAAAVIECARHAEAVFPPLVIVDLLRSLGAAPPPAGSRAVVVTACETLINQARTASVQPAEIQVLDLAQQGLGRLAAAWATRV